MTTIDIDRIPYGWKRVCGRWVKVKHFDTVEEANAWQKANPGALWAYAKPKQL